MPRHRDVQEALEAWRAADRRVGLLDEGTPERAAAEAAAERARGHYHSLIDAFDTTAHGSREREGADRDPVPGEGTPRRVPPPSAEED